MSDGERLVDKACLDLALETMVQSAPVDRDQVRAHANNLSKIAKEHVSKELEIDLALIARAIDYLRQVHAIPPMGNDSSWFSDSLTPLLELARPNAGGVEGEALKFLDDVAQGVQALKERSGE